MSYHGKRLSDLARANKLTQKEIAKRIGVSSQSVNSDFQEEILSEKRLIKYRDVLNLDVERFLAGEDPPIFTASQSQIQTVARVNRSVSQDTDLRDKLIAMQERVIEELERRLKEQTVELNF